MDIKSFTYLLFVFISVNKISYTQVTSGTIEFERRTNLQKVYTDERMKGFLNDKNKILTETFQLTFTESSSLFEFIEKPTTNSGQSGFGDWISRMTVKTNIYRESLNSNQFLGKMNLAGEFINIVDTIAKKEWKVTENTRKIAGYTCKQVVWNVSSGVNIYAWYCDDIIPSVGPETFGNLPGAILGLATEDGGITYFATKVNPTQQVVINASSMTKSKAITFFDVKEKYLKNVPGISEKLYYTW